MQFEDEERLQRLRNERDSIQARPHDGFEDATRVNRLNSQIQMLEGQLTREKQRGQRGQG